MFQENISPSCLPKNRFKCKFQGKVLKDQHQIHQKRSCAGTAPPEQLKKHILCCPWSHSLDFPPLLEQLRCHQPQPGVQTGRAALKSNTGLAAQDGKAELGCSSSWRGEGRNGNDAKAQLQHQLGSGLIPPSLGFPPQMLNGAGQGETLGNAVTPARQGIPFSPGKVLLCPFSRWNFREFHLLECPEEEP